VSKRDNKDAATANLSAGEPTVAPVKGDTVIPGIVGSNALCKEICLDKISKSDVRQNEMRGALCFVIDS
jgi:hypothetical protein